MKCRKNSDGVSWTMKTERVAAATHDENIVNVSKSFFENNGNEISTRENYFKSISNLTLI